MRTDFERELEKKCVAILQNNSVEYWIRLNETNTDVRIYTLEFIHTL